jgi:GTP diphosphokinase / guanosine-3',5'-bis(diphosphate) 3'-diphosphatase
MLIAMVDDLRVIIVKLADRLHNMQTLDHHPDPKKRERIALETLNIYAPIADRLGIFEFKEALETQCFRILYPEEYTRISMELAELREEQDFFLHKAKEIIHSVIHDVPILDISYRIKSPYSIYRKLSRKDYSYTHTRDIYDLFAIRILTDDVRHCYEILGILHNIFIPMPKRFKDYIALPKENGYQSLHTTVVGLFPDVRSQPTEIQIRTQDMHRQAEIGVAAHFEYSESGKSKKSKDSYWVKMIK